MSFSVVFRRAAEVEFADAAAWYESQCIGLGVEFSSEVEQAIEKDR